MFNPFKRSIILASALASAGMAAFAMTADARTSYDGSWSVLIITDSGTCDRAYRYGLEISNGNVLYGGGGSVNVQGRVAPNGAVQVRVAAGEQEAAGSGRLLRDHGSGAWRGKGPTGTCGGTWEAERRQ